MTDTPAQLLPEEKKAEQKVHLCPECGKKCKIMKTCDEDGRLVDRWRQCICGWTCHPKGKKLPWNR